MWLPTPRTLLFVVFFLIVSVSKSQTVNQAPVISLIPGQNSTVCTDELITLTFSISDDQTPLDNLIFFGTSNITNPSQIYFNLDGSKLNVTVNTVDATIFDSPTLTVYVTDQGGANTVITVPFQIAAKPTIADITTDRDQLKSGETIQCSDLTSGGIWNIENTNVATIDRNGLVTGVSCGQVGIYYEVTNTSGCTSRSSSKYIVVNPLPVAPITGETTVCRGTLSQLFDATPGGTWSSDDPSWIDIDANGNFAGFRNGTANITYTVQNDEGCIGFATTTINLVGIGAGSFITSDKEFYCVGSVLKLNHPISGGVWTSSDASAASVNAQGIVNILSSSPVTIFYFYDNGCKKTTDSYAVNVNKKLSDVYAAKTNLCIGEGTLIAIDEFDIDRSTASWSSSKPSIVQLNSLDGSPSQVIQGNSPGISTLTYSVNTDGCIKTSSLDITVDIHKIVHAAITGKEKLLIGSKTKFTSDARGGVWSNFDTTVATVSKNGYVKGIAEGFDDINYTTSDKGFCSFTTDFPITVFRLLSVKVNINNNSCYGDRPILSVHISGGTANYKYRLNDGDFETFNNSGGDPSQEFIKDYPVTPGFYVVSVQDINSEQVVKKFAFVVNPPPVRLSLLDVDNPSRRGNNGSITVKGDGGSGFYTYSLDDKQFQKSGTFKNLSDGTYNIYARDLNGCEAINPLTIHLKDDKRNGDYGNYDNWFEAKIFPSPSTTEFTLSTTSISNSLIEIQVIDVLGHEVYHTRGEATNTYKFGQNFGKGVFYVKIVFQSTVKVIKIIKE